MWSFVFSFFLIEGLLRFEDKSNAKTLICSLPVRRSAVVLGRYLSSLFFILLIFIIFGLTVFLLNAVLPEYISNSKEIVIIPSLLAAFWGYYLFVSVNLFIYFRFGYLGYPRNVLIGFLSTALTGTIFLGIVYILISLGTGSWSISKFLNGTRGSFTLVNGIINSGIEVLGQPVFILISGLFLAGMVMASISLSIKYFRVRDL
jgi:hypothetical protein